jgi:hypothetical protein
MIEACGRLPFAAEARERFAGIRVIIQHAFHGDDTAGMALAHAGNHTHSAPPNLLKESRSSRDAALAASFDFGEERVQTLAPGAIIFGQPGLE